MNPLGNKISINQYSSTEIVPANKKQKLENPSSLLKDLTNSCVTLSLDERKITNLNNDQLISLPLEILYKIFSYLKFKDIKQVRCFSKPFKESIDTLLQFPSFVADIVKNEDPKKVQIQQEVFKTQTSFKGFEVKVLNIILNKEFSEGCVRKILRSFPDLKELNLEYTTLISGKGLALIIQFFPEIRKLNIGSCTKFTNQEIKDTVAKLGKLEEVSLGFTKIYDAGLLQITQSCPGIRKLNIGWCKQLTSAGIGKAVAKLADLEEINLADTYINDIDLLQIAQFCPKIRKLDLGSCKKLTNAGIKAAFIKLTKLEEARLRCININIDLLWMIAPLCPELRKLDIDCCHELASAGIKETLTQFGKLEEVNLSFSNIDDVGLLQIASLCPKLRKLKLRCCKQLTSVGIGKVIAKLRELEDVDLSLNDFNDADLINFAESGFKKGCTLDLNECPKITSNGFKEAQSLRDKKRAMEEANLDDGIDIN